VTNGSFLNNDSNISVIDPNDDTIVSYNITLTEPGQFYEFTVDIVNDGNLVGLLDEVRETGTTKAELDEIEFLKYTITGLPEKNSLLNPGNENKKTVVIRLEYPFDIEESDLPDSDFTFTKRIELDYVQNGDGSGGGDTPSNNKVFDIETKDGNITQGEEVCLSVENTKTECFYVISSDSTTTTLIAIYNLVIGDDYNENTGVLTPVSTSDPKYGLQGATSVSTNNIVGSSVIFSNSAYWKGNVGTGKTYPGTAELDPYSWEDDEIYSTPYPYVYDSNSLLYTYIQGYVSKLKEMGAPNSITGRALKYQEVPGESDIIKGTFFWAGYSTDSRQIGIINQRGRYTTNYYDLTGYSGVRPVIEVPTSSIDY